MPSSFTRVLPSALASSARPPVSVWGTAIPDLELRGFSWESGMGGPRGASSPGGVGPRLSGGCDLVHPPACGLGPGTTVARPALPPPSPRRNPERRRNVRLLSVACAFQPRLRHRLTLPRLTLDRNPWSSGVRAFDPHYRYLRQHSRLRSLQGASRPPFDGLRNAPLPPGHS